VAIVLFVLFNLMGGFNIPVYPLLIFLIGGLFRIKVEKRDGPSSAVKTKPKKGLRSASLNQTRRTPPDKPSAPAAHPLKARSPTS
jgi:hypothetical protein